MVGAGEGAASHCTEGVGVFGVMGPIRCLLHRLHEAADEEVILQCRDTLLREDGCLPTHRTGQRQALGRDVVLEASGQEGGRAERVSRASVQPSSYLPWYYPSSQRYAVTLHFETSLWMACTSCSANRYKRTHFSQLSRNTSLTSPRMRHILIPHSVQKHRFTFQRCLQTLFIDKCPHFVNSLNIY